MIDFTEARNLIKKNNNNNLKRKETMTREQRLQKQLSISFDILTQEGPHIEISFAAMKTAEILYPSMVRDLKSIIYLHGRYGRMNLKGKAIKFVNIFDKIISFSRQYRKHKIVLEINFLVKKRFHHLKFSN